MSKEFEKFWEFSGYSKCQRADQNTLKLIAQHAWDKALVLVQEKEGEITELVNDTDYVKQFHIFEESA